MTRREFERALDEEFGDVGQAVAHAHDRQVTQQIRNRETEDGRALEMAHGVEHALLIGRIHPGQAMLELECERRAIRRLLEQAIVEEFVDQQRMRGDLVHQQVAMRRQRDESSARSRVMAQQREIRRAPPDRLEHAQYPPQHRARPRRARSR